MDFLPTFPGGVDPVGINTTSFTMLSQEGQAFGALLSQVASLGGVSGFATTQTTGTASSTASGAGASLGADATTQLLLAQNMMGYYQLLNELWRDLARVGGGLGAF